MRVVLVTHAFDHWRAEAIGFSHTWPLESLTCASTPAPDITSFPD